jgi:tungstate transport system substrate-binding protein
MISRRSSLLALLALAALAGTASARERSIVLASTTSTQDSGLFGHILPLFTVRTGIEVKVVAQGTGQALDTARRGDADVVLVHARAQEERFVAEGFGVRRHDVMYNDYVLIGPRSDPAGVKGSGDAAAALRRIAEARAPFVSRGDRSGTHVAELALWKAAGLEPGGGWYREIGGGMGAALNTASGLDAYTLSDRGTWLSFKNRGGLGIALEGDTRLFNPYGVIPVNPERHPHVKREEAQAFVDWITGPEGQAAIAGYRIGGEPVFFPWAKGGS